MKFSLVVLSVATIFAQSAFAAPHASASASASAASLSAAKASSAATASATPQQADQVEPVKLQTAGIDFSKMDPEELETIYQEIEEDILLEDMMKTGWPESQAQMILSLSNIVDSLTDIPEEEEQNEEVVSSLDNVRDSMRDLLAGAGLEFRNTNGNGRTLSRMMTTKNTYSPKAAVALVHGLVNLMRTASKITAMLSNPNLSQYGMMISSAVQMLDNLMRSSKGLVSSGNVPQ